MEEEGVDWSARNSEGIEALGRDEVEEAIALFEACHAAVPEEPVYAHNLAEALARAAVALHEAALSPEQRLAAISRLERAVGLDPTREDLAELLNRWKRGAEVEDGFFIERSEHFVLSYDLEREEVRGEIEALDRTLEEAYLDFSEAFTLWPADGGAAPIRVVLYTRAGFDRVTGIGPWAGGVYDGTIRVPVGDLDRELPRVRAVLRHELLHAFVQEKGGARVPAWLNEGLAQWLEEKRPAARRERVERARAKLAGSQLFGLDELTGSLAGWSDPSRIERAYAQSLALVGWIADHYQGGDVQSVGVLFEMVAGCAEGRPVEETFRDRVGLDLAAVVEDMAQEL